MNFEIMGIRHYGIRHSYGIRVGGQWRSEGPAQALATAGVPARLKGPAWGPPERSSRRNLYVQAPPFITQKSYLFAYEF